MANDGKPVEGSVYFYAPNKVAPAFFTVAFFIAGCIHFWQCIRYKCFKLTALQPFCCLLFTVGFALREYGAFNYEDVDEYIASTILIYCAPPLLELANYHILGRVLFYVPYYAPIHPGRTLTTFGTLSAAVEAMNAIGVSYLTKPNVTAKVQKLGHGLTKASLLIQIGVILLFYVVAGIFHKRCLRSGIRSRKVTAPLLFLYASMGLILARTIYRIIEHFSLSTIPIPAPSDFDPLSLSPVVRYEWFFYVFEASLMLINTVVWNISHPRRYLPEDQHIYLAQDGKTELLGPGWMDDQSWIMTWIDPCGFTAVLTKRMTGKRGPKTPFWQTNGYEHLTLRETNGDAA